MKLTKLDKEAIEYSKNVELPFTIGFEYTFTSDELNRSTINYCCNVLPEYYDSNILQKSISNIHLDNECVEINTYPRTNLLSVIKDYKTIYKFMESHKLFPYNDKYGCGGGHIHIGSINKHGYSLFQLINLYYNIHIVISSMPYLNWIFNEDNDNINANNVGMKINPYKIASNYCKFINVLPDELMFGSKDYGCCINSNNSKADTIEFRIFDSPRSISELITNVIFIHNLLRKFHKHNSNLLDYSNLPQFGNNKHCIAITYMNYINKYKDINVCIYEFNTYLKDTFYNVPPFVRATINKYYKRNLKSRFKLGTKYLT